VGKARARGGRRANGLEIARVQAVACAAACWLFFAAAAAASAQLPNIFATPHPAATAAPLYATAPITLDGVTLFVVTSSVDGNGGLPVNVRAQNVNSVLQSIVAVHTVGGRLDTTYDPETTRVEVSRQSGQPVLAVVDRDHRDPLPIVTVTSADSAYHQTTGDALASTWQETLQGALSHALSLRQPDVQRRNVREAIWLLAGLLAGTLAVYGLVVLSSRRIAALSEERDRHDRDLADEQAKSTTGDAPDAAEHRRRVVDLLVRGLAPDARLQLWRAVRGALLWGSALAWFSAGTWILLLFPATSSFGHALLRGGFTIAAIWIGAALLDRLVSIAIGRLPAIWSLQVLNASEDRAREMLRVPTIVRAVDGFKTFVIVFIAVLTTMAQIGLPVASVVTIGGVAAIAVSLAAQNLIRDFVSGFLVLSEDQYVVGDFVTISGQSGIVERLTLRMVQIREGAGGLVTISHSSATSVTNLSRNWSRVDFSIPVDPKADLPHALTIMRSTIDALGKEPEWSDAVLEPAEWVGIDSIDRNAVVLRGRIRTAPLRQFAVKRELYARVSAAFAAANIGFGIPDA
jgi:small-conductance mechanosensitive channel